jgi:hypothetical protein
MARKSQVHMGGRTDLREPGRKARALRKVTSSVKKRNWPWGKLAL